MEPQRNRVVCLLHEHVVHELVAERVLPAVPVQRHTRRGDHDAVELADRDRAGPVDVLFPQRGGHREAVCTWADFHHHASLRLEAQVFANRLIRLLQAVQSRLDEHAIFGRVEAQGEVGAVNGGVAGRGAPNASDAALEFRAPWPDLGLGLGLANQLQGIGIAGLKEAHLRQGKEVRCTTVVRLNRLLSDSPRVTHPPLKQPLRALLRRAGQRRKGPKDEEQAQSRSSMNERQGNYSKSLR